MPVNKSIVFFCFNWRGIAKLNLFFLQVIKLIVDKLSTALLVKL